MWRRLARRLDRSPGVREPRLPAAGTAAPRFCLEGTGDGPHCLTAWRGAPVVLVFYPEDGSPVCGDQLALYNEALPLFTAHDARLVAISVDDLARHRAFAEERGLRFPLLSDDAPRGAVARAYGVFDDEAGRARRANFVVDGEGIVRWREWSPNHVNPGAAGILAALEALSAAKESGPA